QRTRRLCCPRCRRETSARLPAEIAGSAFGPTLQAALVTMTARNHASRRQISELAGELFGVGLSVGTVDAICQRASAALQDPHERLGASVLEAEAGNVDENGWVRARGGGPPWAAAPPPPAGFPGAAGRPPGRPQGALPAQ